MYILAQISVEFGSWRFLFNFKDAFRKSIGRVANGLSVFFRYMLDVTLSVKFLTTGTKCKNLIPEDGTDSLNRNVGN